MFRETHSYVSPLTVALAKEFAEMPRWRGERPLKRSIVKYLTAEYESGRFHSVSWAIGHLDGQRYRVNGQHSSTLLCQWEDDAPGAIEALKVTAHIAEYVCETQSDLHELFMSFDARHSARDLNDYVGVTMSSHDGLTGVPRMAANRLTAALAVYANEGKSARSVSARERAYYVNEAPSFIAVAAKYARNRLYSAGLGAAMYATYLRAGADSDWSVFWDAVFDESDPDNKSPTRVLAKRVRDTKRDRTDKDIRAMYVRALHAWNAYRTQRTTMLSYYSQAPIPAPR